jgi:hypothetical protein
MKAFIPICLLLLSCANDGLPAASPLENPDAVPIQTTSGNGLNVKWECSQTEINPALVWVSCDFTNTSQATGHPLLASVCVDVNYANGQEVVYANRATCSGILFPGQTIQNYAAFDKHDNIREQLNKMCGHRLMKCKLQAVLLSKR